MNGQRVDDRPYRTFNNTVEKLMHLFIATYRAIAENISVVNRDRCIGCGVCVSKCPDKAIKLKLKEDIIEPPKNTAATYLKIMNKKVEKARAQK